MTENKVLPFPEQSGSPELEPISTRQQRVIIEIGRQRVAFDISTQITKLNPAPAPVTVDLGNRRKPGKSRK
jgi:hypothetical protein